MNKICLIFDVDWIKDEIIQYVVDLLEKYAVMRYF